MHRKQIVVALAALALPSMACDGTMVGPEQVVPAKAVPETVVPFSAVAGISSSLAGAFTATFDLRGGVVDPGKIKVVNGVLRVRGEVSQGPLSGDIAGTGTVVLNYEVDLETLLGSARGSFVFNVTALRGQAVTGTWKGRVNGLLDIPLFIDDFGGNGGGDLKATKIAGIATETAVNNDLFTLTGLITQNGKSAKSDKSAKSGKSAKSDKSGKAKKSGKSGRGEKSGKGGT